MKPIYLELQAFGPYPKKVSVNLEELSRKGMFLIKGPTGSGKTTLFDAMTFALYGGSSGEDERDKGRNDLEEWRCNQAKDNDATYVSFTFTTGGRRYRFTRSLVPKRVNLSPQYEAGEIGGDGVLKPFFENPKKADLTRKAEELIGLTREQFRQVVLLPQGQFEKFLIAPSGEKQEILEKIFRTGRWQDYAEVFYQEAERRKRELDAEKYETDKALKAEALDSLEALETCLSEIKTKASERDAAHAAFGSEKKQKALSDDIGMFERFKYLHELEAKKQTLDEQKQEINERRSLLDAAEKAESLRALLDKEQQAAAELEKRRTALEALASLIPAAKENEERAQAALKRWQAESPVEACTQKLGMYDAARVTYTELDRLQAEFKAAEFAADAARKATLDEDGKYQQAVETAKQAKEKYDQDERQAKSCRDRYYAGIYGEIAFGLTEGEKCPVCGSRQHPEPALRSGDSVSKADVEKAENKAQFSKSQWESAEGQREASEQKVNRKRSADAECQTALAKAKSAYEAARGRMLPGIDSLKALETEIKKLAQQIEKWQQEEQHLKSKSDAEHDKLVKYQSDRDAAQTEYGNARTFAQNAQEELAAGISKHGYASVSDVKNALLPPDTRRCILKAITEYEKACSDVDVQISEKRAELSGRAEPDSRMVAMRQAEITAEEQEYASYAAAAKADIARFSALLTRLSAVEAHYRSEIRQAENDLAFARKLRGDTGIGVQRYVLGIMFDQVIGEANRLLEKIHAGRHRLYRSNEPGGGRKRGLDLKVHDSRCFSEQTDERDKYGRSVRMLSGGEKFLVSLALSIGMSSVAQSSNIRIEALFIDEGFGTLDDSSINDALNVLESVRGSGMIGIISHVKLLEENIPAQLEVIKTEDGSRLNII